jgi:hypothetical protein
VQNLFFHSVHALPRDRRLAGHACGHDPQNQNQNFHKHLNLRGHGWASLP